MKFVSNHCGDAVAEVVQAATFRLVIVAPYITQPALAKVLARFRQGVSLLVITRWSPSDVALGVSDTRVVDTVVSFGGKLLLHPMLHAKLYMADDRLALVGSANVTEKALGLSVAENVELLVLIEPVPLSLLVFLRRLEKGSLEATEDLRRSVEARARELSLRPLGKIEVFDCAPIPRAEWYPEFRFPELLFSLYSAPTCVPGDDRDAAVEDLAEISIPEGLNEFLFKQHVRDFLLSLPLVKDLDSFLRVPRRFGELCEWIGKRIRVHTRSVVQRKTQTLIRWLCYFAGDKYSVVQPRYTEILVLRSSSSSLCESPSQPSE